MDVDEVAVWVATHGWALKDAKKFRDLAGGVRNGTKFRGIGQRAISRDHDRERKLLAHWRQQLAT